MSSEFMRRTADVLEKLAEHLDREELTRQDGARQERLKVATALSEKYAAATGEDLSKEILEQIADSNHDVIRVFEKLATRIPHNTPPDTMGESENPDDVNTATGNSRSERTKTAASDADQHFVNWIME